MIPYVSSFRAHYGRVIVADMVVGRKRYVRRHLPSAWVGDLEAIMWNEFWRYIGAA